MNLNQKPRHHVIISGTGRAGTSFLVQLLSELGLDTGFTETDSHINKNARAGLEHDIRNPASPYIVKSPWFCDYAEDVFKNPSIKIDHLFIPMRDASAAAKSRQYVVDSSKEENKKPSQVQGGFWHTDKPGDQETILYKQLYKLVFAASDAMVPVTLMRYPRITNDSQYLFKKLLPILKNKSTDEFTNAFKKTVQPAWVHSFSEVDK